MKRLIAIEMQLEIPEEISSQELLVEYEKEISLLYSQLISEKYKPISLSIKLIKDFVR